MNKLADLIRKLPAQDVQLIKQDLDEGNIAKVIQERLAEIELPQKVCPVCNAPVSDDAPFVLYFGTLVRKKARFDGRDCLQVFVRDMDGEAPAKRKSKK